MTHRLAIIKQEFPPSMTPYKLMETYITSDGYRSRLCDGAWKDFTSAKTEYDRKEALRAN